ncbi:MAG: nucleoside recognition domain-containing protein, partial [Oscillospiraceae bacterium]|nr:nucleoside recognition domain-containing protein [Oscillospiraceae bacterium]
MKRRRMGLWSILILIGVLILRSKAVQAGVRSGLAICGRVLIPALFPFSVLSGLLLRSGGASALGAKADGWMRRRFHLPGQAAAPLLTGLMGGYPLGAQSLAALYKAGGLTKSEAVALSAFCNQPGPAFLVGAVGASVFGEPRLGL